MTSGIPTGLLNGLTLAAGGDWIEVVVYGIGTVILVGGWIANQLKQLREEQERRRRVATLEGGDAAPSARRPGDAQPMPTQADLARRRREQLAALSRRRAGASEPDGREAEGADPVNLSPHEKTQRERAREAYERRARQLREQREEAAEEKQAARDRYERELARRREQAERARRDRRLGQKARGEAQSGGQRKPVTARATRTSSTSPTSSTQPTSVPPMQLSGGQADARAAARREAARREEAKRSAAMAAARRARATVDAARSGAGPVVTAEAIGRVDLATLQRAMVLKEVLDRPVALRDPLEGVPGLA